MKTPRMKWSGIVALIGVVAIYLLAPQQLPVVTYKFMIIMLAAVLGYYLDRELFPYARPHEDLKSPHRMLRRAIIVAAAMLSAGLAA